MSSAAVATAYGYGTIGGGEEDGDSPDGCGTQAQPLPAGAIVAHRSYLYQNPVPKQNQVPLLGTEVKLSGANKKRTGDQGAAKVSLIGGQAHSEKAALLAAIVGGNGAGGEGGGGKRNGGRGGHENSNGNGNGMGHSRASKQYGKELVSPMSSVFSLTRTPIPVIGGKFSSAAACLALRHIVIVEKLIKS